MFGYPFLQGLLVIGILSVFLTGCAVKLDEKTVPDQPAPSMTLNQIVKSKSAKPYPFGTFEIQKRHGLGGWRKQESIPESEGF